MEFSGVGCSRDVSELRLENTPDGMDVRESEFMPLGCVCADGLDLLGRDYRCVNILMLANVPGSRDVMGL